MVKKILCLLAPIFVCSTILLVSCANECEHKYLSAVTIAPTCESEGYTLNTCTECRSEFKTNYKLPTGHTLTETVFSPTCEKAGYTNYSCACGYSYNSEALPPSGHSYKKVTVAATCTSAGYTEYMCTVCEHTYRSDFVSATGHTIQETVYRPTSTLPGYTELECTVCQHNHISDIVFYNDVYGGGYIDAPTVVAKGIDVSKWQHTLNADGSYKPLNWTAIKEAGIDFAILRVGYTGSVSGTINKDPVFEMNYEGAKAAGVMVGAYYYSVASTEEELDLEIDALLTWIEGKKFEYPIYFDIEDKSLANGEQKDTLTKLCMRFVTVMRENGYYGAVYANQNWLDNFLFRESLEGFCDIWYAHYTESGTVTVNDTFTWDEKLFGPTLSMWQYTDSGIIEGSNMDKSANVDMNYSYKDFPSIVKKYGLNGFTNDKLSDR